MGPEKAVSPCPAPSSPPCQGRGEHQQSSLSLPLAPETFTETQVSSFLLLREGNRMVNWKKQALWLAEQAQHAGERQPRADTSPSPSSISANSSARFGLKKSSHQGNNYSQWFLVLFWRFAADIRLTRLCCLASFSLASSSSFWILRTCLFILRIVECKISQTNSLKVIRHLVTVC